jgi:hypothetical protein
MFCEKLEKLIPWFFDWETIRWQLGAGLPRNVNASCQKSHLCVRAPRVSTFIAATGAFAASAKANAYVSYRWGIIGDTRGIECVVSSRFGSQRRANPWYGPAPSSAPSSALSSRITFDRPVSKSRKKAKSARRERRPGWKAGCGATQVASGEGAQLCSSIVLQQFSFWHFEALDGFWTGERADAIAAV